MFKKIFVILALIAGITVSACWFTEDNGTTTNTVTTTVAPKLGCQQISVSNAIGYADAPLSDSLEDTGLNLTDTATTFSEEEFIPEQDLDPTRYKAVVSANDAKKPNKGFVVVAEVKQDNSIRKPDAGAKIIAIPVDKTVQVFQSVKVTIPNVPDTEIFSQSYKTKLKDESDGFIKDAWVKSVVVTKKKAVVDGDYPDVVSHGKPIVTFHASTAKGLPPTTGWKRVRHKDDTDPPTIVTPPVSTVVIPTADLPLKVLIAMQPRTATPSVPLTMAILQYKLLPSGSWVNYKTITNPSWTLNFTKPAEVFGPDCFDPPNATTGQEYLLRTYFTDGVYENADLDVDTVPGGDSVWKKEWVFSIKISGKRIPGR